jgi:serine/threonine-protein kinase
MSSDPIETVNAQELIGHVLDGRYRVEAVLGQGGMGMVFKGLQTSVQRPVALKTLHPQLAMAPTFFERFRREAEVASRLHHPNIITIFDFGRTPEGLCYYVMEYLAGESLKERIKRDGPFSLRQAAAVIEQAAAGVAHAHHQNVIHRDLKPHNIMLAEVDGHEYVKVLDFGLVKALEQEDEEQLTSTGQVLGTPQYMPPEQAGGELVDQRSDLFALTAVFFYCLTGHSPYGANSVRKALTLALAGNVPPVSTYRQGAPVPKAVDEFIWKGLRPDKEERFQTAEDFVQSLHAAIAGTPDTLLDALPAFTPASGGDAGSGSSSASRKSGSGSRARPASKSISAVSRPLPKASSSRVEVNDPSATRAEPGRGAEPPRAGLALGAIVGLAAVVVVLIGAAVVWKLSPRPEGAPLPPPPVADPPTAPPAQPSPAVEAPAAAVKVTLRTTPEGAEVLEDDVVIGTTPLTLEWPRGKTRSLTFKATGHRELQKTLRLEADQTLDFALESSVPKAPGVKKPGGTKKQDPDIGAFD